MHFSHMDLWPTLNLKIHKFEPQFLRVFSRQWPALKFYVIHEYGLKLGEANSAFLRLSMSAQNYKGPNVCPFSFTTALLCLQNYFWSNLSFIVLKCAKCKSQIYKTRHGESINCSLAIYACGLHMVFWKVPIWLCEIPVKSKAKLNFGVKLDL